MDKYEYKIRSEEIKTLIAQGEYAEAAEIADAIDWRRVKSVMMLCTISDLYKINRRYEDARDMLLLAYDRHPGGRTIVYSLCELSIKMEEFVQAVEYYKEFVQIAPKDTGRYVLQYKLYEAQEVSLEERIEVLEELKKRDYREKWAYELAYLYHRVGLGARCVEECDELILWFGEGRYVIKALELKMLHAPLTAEQQKKYHVLNGGAPAVESEPAQNDVFEDDIQVKTMDVGKYNTINLQKELAEGLREVLGEPGQSIQDEVTRSIVAPMMETGALNAEGAGNGPAAPEEMSHRQEQMQSSEVFFGETGELGNVEPAETEEYVPEEPERSEQSSKVVSMSGYRSFDRHMRELSAEPVEEALPEEDASGGELPEEEQEEAEALPESGDTPAPAPVSDDTGEIVMEQLRQESLGIAREAEAEPASGAMPAFVPELPKSLADVLSMEGDGQISLVVPEAEQIEKQITGQMNIEDILAEWERMKKDSEEKRKEAVRKRVMEQTGSMFTEFEAAVRDGLLEKLEKENNKAAAEKAAPAAPPLNDGDEVEELEEIEEASAEEAGIEEPVFAGKAEAGDAEAGFEAAYADEAEIEEAGYEDEAETGYADEADSEEPGYGDEAGADYAEEPDIEGKDYTEPEEDEAEAGDAEETYADEADGEDDAIEWEGSGRSTASGPVKQKEKESVERDLAKVRSLTREERELYAPYIQNKSARERLVAAIDGISMDAFTGNVIVTGDEGMDTMTLAKNMIREIQMADSNFSGKVAKISGQALNRKDVDATLQQFKNGALIIQKASGMENSTADALYKALQKESFGIIVVMEDTKKAINKFLKEHEKLAAGFTSRMDVEAMSNESLVSFGRKYARELEYSFDELGVLALHTRIEDMQTSDHVVTVMEVKEIVDEAIRHANKKTLGHFFDILLAKRYDDEDMIILRENDFV